MRRRLFSILILTVASARVDAGCVEPATLAHSTVGITRYFDDDEKKAMPSGVLGINATGWFLSPLLMVTAKHVAVAMNLSEENWKQVEMRNEGNAHSIAVRIQHFAGLHAEKIAVLELQTTISGVQGFQARMEPLVSDERVVSLAYPGGRLRVVGGRFVQYSEDDLLAGTGLLEMYDGNDRLALDHGASGAPVFDCAGRVVAVVSNLMSLSMQFMSRTVRVPTAWGSSNVTSVPVQVLKDFSRAH